MYYVRVEADNGGRQRRGVKGVMGGAGDFSSSFMRDAQVKRQDKQSLMTQVIGPSSPNRVLVRYWVI